MPPRSAATRRTPGASTTCTATRSSGAATGTTPAPARRDGSRPARRRRRGHSKSATDRSPGLAEAALGRRRLGLPVGASPRFEPERRLRPHRVPGRPGSAVAYPRTLPSLTAARRAPRCNSASTGCAEPAAPLPNVSNGLPCGDEGGWKSLTRRTCDAIHRAFRTRARRHRAASSAARASHATPSGHSPASAAAAR